MNIVYQPYEQSIHCQDESISYPLKPDTITHVTLAIVTITCTIIIISSGEAYLVYSKTIHSNSTFNQYVAAIYKVLGAFLFGGAVSQSLTDLAKYTIGRPRPHFLTVCAPKVCKGYVALNDCTGEANAVTEARLKKIKTFYVQARLNAKWARLLRPTIQFFLVAFAVYVGYTRVSDYKHHWSDVLVGLLQGALIAILTVRYVSNFFRVRPYPQCSSAELAENEERKPSLHLSEVEHNNHLGYSGSA
ncbi:Phospholipid phosphatase 2 [Labeo rohita]|uniref:Phospholipid phosphatase 2 n=1 Tax=Labeo rohita TaxID=84645 RepID=A0ABQ8LI69_LABRO|nr:Phospholipid phosphatase 2 [Labeo rohita]